jgi:glycine/D-amino acid oxidase-like deaminating enzyme/nitrite reductase/ring-hydroxylating ferredoxin subunit
VAARIPLNRPFWLEGAGSRYPSLSGELDVDVAVVGAGITGVTTAYLLKRAGKSVALLEQSSVGFGATGYTTAKLTVGHNLIYRDLIETHGEDAARLYARSNQEAIEQIAATVAEHELDCDLEGTSNFVYGESPASVGELEQELEAARTAGIDATLTTETDLPYSVAAALRVDGQAQFHPWKYLAALAGLVDGDGSRVFESTRVRHVRSGSPCVVEADGGRVRASHVVVATQMPFLDRGLFFAKAHPTKSYAVAATVDAGSAPNGMYISADEPTRSVRSTPAADGRRVLIVGGDSHTPGTEDDTQARYARLERFLAERFGVGPAEYRWSTHDYVPVDRLPYIGRLRRGDEHVLVATGFAKWGLTKGTLAAQLLTDAIFDVPNEYAELYDAKRLAPKQSAVRFAKGNGAVGLRFFADRLRPRDGRAEIERLQPGAGAIVRHGVRLYAVHRDVAGALHVLSARCTHLGCIVGWNAADQAWECQCHGSRFAGDGTLVQGPATADLPRRSLRD